MNKLTPEKIAELQPDSKLNLVFDIDHTLIFAIDKKLYPKLLEDYGKEWGHNIHKLVLGEFFRIYFLISSVQNIGDGRTWSYEMWLIVRYGVFELLDYLNTFCNFYVYSHGFHTYIKEILNKIDPDEKYFKNREQTVITPKDNA